MKPMLLLAASTLALSGLVACSSKPATRAALDCPEVQGELTRTGRAPDGRSCTYATKSGAEVALQLVSTGGDPAGALQRIEDSLTPPMTPEERAAEAEARKADATAVAATAGASASDAAAVAREAEADAGKVVAERNETDGDSNGVDAKIVIGGEDGPTVHARGEGETTHVRLPGINITAGEDTAKVQVGGITVDADGDSDTVTVRRFSDVRMRGESLSPQKRGVRATLVRKGEFAGGYHVVGYEAGGPKTGPITVATVRAKGDLDRHGGDIYDDIRELVRKNGGV